MTTSLHETPAIPATPQPCPPWCLTPSDPDPFHAGTYSPVPLSLSGETLLARLEHGITEGTTVALVREDDPGLDLTLAEAGHLRDVLDILIRQASPLESALADALAAATLEASRPCLP
jgi:hypothetical protein